jgi:adenylylsulfate kinase
MDFDGVVAQYDGWRGEDALGDPAPGAREFVDAMKRRGYMVILHSTRPAWRLMEWCALHDFRFDGYNSNPQFDGVPGERSGKPVADVYIDDRAVRHEGDWAATEAATIAGVGEAK